MNATNVRSTLAYMLDCAWDRLGWELSERHWTVLAVAFMIADGDTDAEFDLESRVLGIFPGQKAELLRVLYELSGHGLLYVRVPWRVSITRDGVWTFLKNSARYANPSVASSEPPRIAVVASEVGGNPPQGAEPAKITLIKASEEVFPPLQCTSDYLPGLSWSEDYSTVRLRSHEFELSPSRAEIIKLMIQWSQPQPKDLRPRRLLKEANSRSKSLQDIFKRLPGWRTLIVPGTQKGTYRLNLLPETRKD